MASKFLQSRVATTAFACHFGGGRFSFRVLHGAYFSPRKPLNTTQLIGETL